MRDINKAILMGRLGADPIKRSTQNGTTVVHFPVATSRQRKKEDELTEETQWHHIVAWGVLGENCSKYLEKGRAVYVEGAIQSSSYEGKDGVQRTSFEIVANDVNFIGPHSKPVEAQA